MSHFGQLAAPEPPGIMVCGHPSVMRGPHIIDGRALWAHAAYLPVLSIP